MLDEYHWNQEDARALADAGYMPLEEYLRLCKEHGWTPKPDDKPAELTAAITLTITLSDIEAHALAMLIASLGQERFEDAYQRWLNHWKATEVYNPDVEANTIDLMSEATEKLYSALTNAGFDVLSRLGPRN